MKKNFLIGNAFIILVTQFSFAQISSRNQSITTKKEVQINTVTSLPSSIQNSTISPKYSEAFNASFNWYVAINPSEFGINYNNPPSSQAFYDSAKIKYIQKKEISFANLPYSPGLNRIQQDSLMYLRALPNLKTVFLNSNICTDVVLQFLSSIKTITGVSYPLNQAGNLPITFSFDITDKSIAMLTQTRMLEHLQLTNCSLLTSVCFSNFKNLSTLKYLSLSNCRNISDKALLYLEGCTQLETLALINCQIGPEGLINLRSILNTLPGLKTIYFRSNGVTRDEFYAFISACNKEGFKIGGVW